jgi:hypothetical protein
MKTASEVNVPIDPTPISIPPEIAAKCDGPD